MPQRELPVIQSFNMVPLLLHTGVTPLFMFLFYFLFFIFLSFVFLSFVVVVVVAISWAAPAAYGGSQARG